MSAVEFEFEIADIGGTVCITGGIRPSPWIHDEQELANDLARCLKPGHVVTAWVSGDEASSARAAS